MGVLILARLCAIGGDVLTLLLTLMKTFRQWRDSRRLNVRSSLTTCLVRDGESYDLSS